MSVLTSRHKIYSAKQHGPMAGFDFSGSLFTWDPDALGTQEISVFDWYKNQKVKKRKRSHYSKGRKVCHKSSCLLPEFPLL